MPAFSARLWMVRFISLDNVEVDAHVVMPNHVHAIVMIDGEHCFLPKATMKPGENTGSALASPKAGSLATVTRSYKSGVTRRCHELGLNIAWQSRFHDHLLRGDKMIGAVREYIRNNPGNWGVDRENPFRPVHP
jgi:putative transposase